MISVLNKQTNNVSVTDKNQITTVSVLNKYTSEEININKKKYDSLSVQQTIKQYQ